MRGNLGACAIKRRRRRADPMDEFDKLPPLLRQWLATAALPWSPRSCRRLWAQSRAQGYTDAEALARLDQIEAAMLTKEPAKAA